jgi:hypothetical protein
MKVKTPFGWAEDGTAPKPPLGLTPRYVVRQQRIAAILGAIYRYTDANISVPPEWISELHDLIFDHNTKRHDNKSQA